MKKSILILAILISGLVSAQGTWVAGQQTNAVGKVADAPSVYKINQLSQITGDQSAHAGQTWVLEDDIDCLGGDIDLSGYNITLKDGGGLFTNFNSFNLGDFRTDGNSNATYFDQSFHITSGTVTTEPTDVYVSVIGECLDEVVYVNWFSPNKNANLIVDSTLNGALPDHISIQNAISVTPKENGTIALPSGAIMMQGDATNAEYPYTETPYNNDGIPVTPDSGTDDYLGTHQGFTFENFNNLTILGNGVTIIANPNNSNIVNNRGFYFKNCDDVYIENLKYDGNLVQRGQLGSIANPFNNQHGMAFGGCDNPVLFRVTMTDCTMDGFYFGTFGGVVGSGGTMTECKALYNYRNGLSGVTHSSLSVYKSTFSFTGQRLRLLDGSYQTHSPSAGIDLEAGGSGTSPGERGQFDWIFEGNTFESNYGAGLSPHWGTTRCLVNANIFIDDTLFEPQDSVEETTGNNTYTNNSFTNSTVRLEGGGAHFIGNTFYFDDLSKSYGFFPPFTNVTNVQAITILDPDNHYDLGYTRKTIVRDNLIKVEATNSNFPVEADVDFDGLTIGGITVSVKESEIVGNRFINTLGIKDTGADNTMVDITEDNCIVNKNEWKLTTEALAKYTGNVGRFSIANHKSFNMNKVNDTYGSLNIKTQSNFRGVQIDGAFATNYYRMDDIDSNDAVDLFFPNAEGNIRLTIVSDNSVLNPSTIEVGFSTYDTSNIKVRSITGTDTQCFMYTEPFIKNGLYCITVKHDNGSRVDGQVKAEWFGMDENTVSPDDMFKTKYGYSESYTFHRIYDGGKQGNTASIPTTGGVGNYTEIKEGAKYYNTETHIEMYHNGTSFVNP